MGFWKSFFGGETDPEEEKKKAAARNFDLLKYDGVKAMRIGQFDYAVKCFEKALETKEDPEVRDYLSRALIQTGRLDEAMQQLQLMMRLLPTVVDVKVQAASVAFMMEDYDLMAEISEQALKQLPNEPMLHLLYAKAEIGRKAYVQAVARLTASISLRPDLVESRLLRAQVLFRLGDMGSVQQDMEWLMAHAADNEDVLMLNARLQTALQHPDEAVSLYGKVIDLNPFRIEAFRERGRLRLEAGDKEGAEADMKMVLELNPQEMAGVSGEYSAEGIEHKVKQAYSNMNPFGI